MSFEVVLENSKRRLRRVGKPGDHHYYVDENVDGRWITVFSSFSWSIALKAFHDVI